MPPARWLTSFYLVLYLEVNQILLLMLAVSVVVASWRCCCPRCRIMRALALGLLAALAWPAPRTSADPPLIHSERSLYRQVFVYGD